MAHPAMTLAIASRTVPPWSESKAKGNSFSPVSRDTLTPGKRRVAAPYRQRQRVTSRGSRFSSRSTRRSVSSLSVLTSIAPVSGRMLACRVRRRDLRGRVQTVQLRTAPHDRECQPASRNTPLRVQRQRLRVQLVDRARVHRSRLGRRISGRGTRIALRLNAGVAARRQQHQRPTVALSFALSYVMRPP